jgi:hypothetical protein
MSSSALQDELDGLLSENAELRNQCDVLEVHLVTVAKNLERRLNLSIARNKAAEQEIKQLEAEIQEKEFLIRETKSLFRDLCLCGWDLSSSSRLDFAYYAHLFRGKLPSFPRGAHRFDPIVFRIISTIPDFHNCESNESFLDKCEELVNAIAQLSDGSPIVHDRNDHEMRLREEQVAFQSHFAHKSVRTMKVLDEHGRLQLSIVRARSSVRGNAENQSRSRSSRSSLFL